MYTRLARLTGVFGAMDGDSKRYMEVLEVESQLDEPASGAIDRLSISSERPLLYSEQSANYALKEVPLGCCYGRKPDKLKTIFFSIQKKPDSTRPAFYII